MIIVTRKDIAKEDYERIEKRLTDLGFRLHPIVGVERIVIGAIGDRRMVDLQALASLPGVEQV
ncbi:MAG: 3-deoxy-7-phosphoheptulonate synthase, partial [Alicyclobacillus sp.]|nr:3-deoxy-7-phosphoheptulonate synthase [Alicyclobacillus sp.]